MVYSLLIERSSRSLLMLIRDPSPATGSDQRTHHSRRNVKSLNGTDPFAIQADLHADACALR